MWLVVEGVERRLYGVVKAESEGCAVSFLQDDVQASKVIIPWNVKDTDSRQQVTVFSGCTELRVTPTQGLAGINA